MKRLPTAAGDPTSTPPASEMRRVLAGLAKARLMEAAPSVGGQWRMYDRVRSYLDTARSADKHLRAVPI